MIKRCNLNALEGMVRKYRDRGFKRVGPIVELDSEYMTTMECDSGNGLDIAGVACNI